MKSRTRRLTLTVFAAASALGAGGCISPGHGKQTSKALADSQERMGQMKAATEWDMARQQFLAGDLGKALKTVDKAITLNNSVPKSHTLRGRILLELGQTEQAIESFQRSLAIDASYVEAHYYYGITLERFSQYANALEKYQTADTLDPANPQYPLAAAEMLIELDRVDEAEQFLAERRARFQHNAGFCQTLGHIARMRHDDAQAATLFEQARMLAPDDLGILEDLAVAQLAAGKATEAEYSLRTLLREPANADRRDLQHMHARCLIEMDRPVEARALLLRLTSDERGQGDVRAWFELGQVAFKLNDMARVKISANRLIAIAPQQHEGHYLMAAWQWKQGDMSAALASLDRAAASSTIDPAPVTLRGVVLQALGRNEEARRAFAEALRLDPADERARLRLAEATEEN